MTAKYDINIRWSDDDHCYVAICPDLEGCMADGETPEEAVRELMIAQEGWLAISRERGWQIPEPKRRNVLEWADKPGRKVAKRATA